MLELVEITFFQDKLFEVESEDQQGWRRPKAKKLDSIIGSDQWGRKKKSDDLGGKRKRGIVGFDLWGKRKRAQLNIEDDAEDIAHRNTELEGMMEKRAIVGLDLWGRRKRITSSRNIMLGTGNRCPRSFGKIKQRFSRKNCLVGLRVKQGNGFAYLIPLLIRYQKSCHIDYLETVVKIVFYSQKVKPTNCQAISDWKR